MSVECFFSEIETVAMSKYIKKINVSTSNWLAPC